MQGGRYCRCGRDYRGASAGTQKRAGLMTAGNATNLNSASNTHLNFQNSGFILHRRISFAYLIGVFLATVISVAAQQAPAPKPSPTPTPEEKDTQEPVKVFTEEVRLQVIATDQYGHYDPTLVADDVLVLEDG